MPLTRAIAATLAALIIASDMATAQTPDTQGHAVQRLYTEAPCRDVIARIDDPQSGLEGLGNMAMAFGFLMGFEVENPGIRGTHETILKRLRADCSATPDRPALDILRSYGPPG